MAQELKKKKGRYEELSKAHEASNKEYAVNVVSLEASKSVSDGVFTWLKYSKDELQSTNQLQAEDC